MWQLVRGYSVVKGLLERLCLVLTETSTVFLVKQGLIFLSLHNKLGKMTFGALTWQNPDKNRMPYHLTFY